MHLWRFLAVGIVGGERRLAQRHLLSPCRLTPAGARGINAAPAFHRGTKTPRGTTTPPPVAFSTQRARCIYERVALPASISHLQPFDIHQDNAQPPRVQEMRDHRPTGVETDSGNYIHLAPA